MDPGSSCTCDCALDAEPEVIASGPAVEAEVHRAAFHALLRGEPAGVLDLVAATRLSTAAVQEALAGLVRARRVRVDRDGRVTTTAGLTTSPSTPHRLEIDGRSVHTLCAVDAVGIPAALGLDAVALGRCHHCGLPLEVELRGGRAEDERDLRVWHPGTTGEDVWADYCPNANLFCSLEHLEAWRAGAGSPPGSALRLPEVESLGRAWWGSLAPAAPAAQEVGR